VKLLTVLGLGAVKLWAAIPAGLALRPHPLGVGIAAAIGAILGVLVVLMLGEQVRTRLLRWHERGEDRQRGRIYRIWTRYGLVGLGLLAGITRSIGAEA